MAHKDISLVTFVNPSSTPSLPSSPYQSPVLPQIEAVIDLDALAEIQGITDNWSPVSSPKGTGLGTEAGSSTPKPEQGKELQSLPLTQAGWDQYEKGYDSVLRRVMSSLGKEEYAQDPNSVKNQKEISTRGQGIDRQGGVSGNGRNHGSMVTRIWSQTSDDIENELSMSTWMQTYPSSNVLIVWDLKKSLGLAYRDILVRRTSPTSGLLALGPSHILTAGSCLSHWCKKIDRQAFFQNQNWNGNLTTSTLLAEGSSVGSLALEAIILT
ncbi:hypothetical protein BYT27DRAFT_7207447 [Phlegmacium glaucopus]|nr:hypothetical protein BYT27DRAFT_7207447 [Phlegmacium glaucopus]